MPTSYRILHMISSINPVGGGPIAGVKALGRELANFDIELECASCDSAEDPWVKNFPFKLYPLGPSWFKYRYSPRIVPWLRENYKKYDAIFVNGIWQYHSFAVWQALSSKSTPYFVFPHGMLDPWFKKTYRLKHFKKWLYWPWAEYRVLRDAKAVIFTCKKEEALAKDSFWLHQWNSKTINYGVSNIPKNTSTLCENFLLRFPILRGKKIILFLGRICEKKGCDLLIEAFAKVSHLNADLYLVMAGPDQNNLSSKLKERALSLGIEDKIIWPGMLNNDEKWGAFYAAEVFSLPSHQENFGIAVVEALASSRPVLISNQINIYEEIEVFGAGIVEPDDLEGTCRALNRWLQMGSKEVIQMQLAAKQCYDSLFSIESFAKDIISLIDGSQNELNILGERDL